MRRDCEKGVLVLVGFVDSDWSWVWGGKGDGVSRANDGGVWLDMVVSMMVAAAAKLLVVGLGDENGFELGGGRSRD